MFARYGYLAASGLVTLLMLSGCGTRRSPSYDSPPVLANREEITAAMRAVGAGLEARVVLLVRVDSKGRVEGVRVGRSSGNDELDNAAMWIGEQMRFDPARYEGAAVAALIEIPITFDVVSRVVRPVRLRNAEEIAGYVIRDHGELRGTARFRVHVGPEGWVREVKDRWPHDREVQDAARPLIEDLKFWPAYRGDSAKSSWVNLTFEFAGPATRIYLDSPGA